MCQNLPLRWFIGVCSQEVGIFRTLIDSGLISNDLFSNENLISLLISVGIEVTRIFLYIIQYENVTWDFNNLLCTLSFIISLLAL